MSQARRKVEDDTAECHPGRHDFEPMTGAGEIEHMHQNHKHDRHRKEVKMGDFCQFPKDIGSPNVASDPR